MLSLRIDKINFCLTIFALVLIFPYVYITITSPYAPGGDESWQLQAAYRLANNHGYTSTREFIPDDLSTPEYRHLTGWPIGYSLIIAGFLKLGITLDTAVKSFKITTIILGLYLWISFARNFIASLLSMTFFTLVLCLTCILHSNAPTDLFLWTMMPVFSYLMLTIRQASVSEMQHSTNQFLMIVLCSLLVSLLILIKYLSLVLIVIGSIWLILTYRYEFRRLITRLVAYSSAPILIFSGITYSNTLFGGMVSTMTAGKIDFHWTREYVSEFLQAIVLGTFYLDNGISFLMNKLSLNAYQKFINLSITFLLFIALVFIIHKIWKRNVKLRIMVQWFTLLFTCFACFLFLLTVLYNFTIEKIPFAESRYYWSVMPILLIIILTATLTKTGPKVNGERLNFISKICIVVFLLFAEAGIITYSMYKSQKLEQFYTKREVAIREINRVRALDKEASAVGIADNMFAMFVWKDFLPTYRNLESAFNSNTHFSNPTWVFIVGDETSQNIKMLENDKRSDDISTAHKYGMTKLESNEVIIYWRKFERGSLKPQI